MRRPASVELGSNGMNTHASYVKYIEQCALAEVRHTSQHDFESEVERQDAEDFIVYYWEMVVFNLGEWEPTMGPQITHQRVPADTVDNVRGLFQCQSNCLGRAMVRIYFPDLPLTVDLCNHHYNKVEQRDQAHNYVILKDRREELVG